MDREAIASTDPTRPEPVGDNTPIPFDPARPAELVHFTDPRVRELAEARWRTDTGRDHQSWLVDGPRDRGNPYVREARDWLRAAVAIGLLTPIETDGSRRPILATGADVQCTFCGQRPDKHRTVVTGPGVNICNWCVELCSIVVKEAAETSAARPSLRTDDDDQEFSGCEECGLPLDECGCAGQPTYSG